MNVDVPVAPGQEVSTDGAAPAIKLSAVAPRGSTDPSVERRTVIELQDLSCFYGSFRAVRNVSIEVKEQRVTALIGPSGCGKSTLLRTINRMNDLVPIYRTEGRLLLSGQDLYGKDVDPVAVRRRVGMVFQKPNPFPKTVWENVAFGPKINGYKGDMNELVERSLRRAALWDEVKDKLKQSGMALSGGQQQRLCIARTIAVEPEVILMDEPCSALDPRSTLQIEELMAELKQDYTIVDRDAQHAAGGPRLRHDGLPDDGRGPGGLRGRAGRHARDLHQPQEPTDRGLRLGSLRMSGEEPTMTDEQRSAADTLTEQVNEIVDRAASAPTSADPHPPRETLDREQREVKDSVLRMGIMVEEAIRAAIKALTEHDADAALAVIAGDGRINEAQRHASTLIARTIATQGPVARDLRFLLSLDHVTYELERIGDHAASVAKQARKLAPDPPLKAYMDLPEMGELAADLVHGILRALVDIDQVEARAVAARDDEIDDLYHGPSPRWSS